MKILDPKRDEELLRAAAEATRQQRIEDRMTPSDLIPTYETMHRIIGVRQIIPEENLQGGSPERK